MTPFRLLILAILVQGLLPHVCAAQVRVIDHELVNTLASESERSSAIGNRASMDEADRKVRPARPSSAELAEGELWICAVGQSPAVNEQAYRQSRLMGYGFWSLAPHRKCPAGVYLAVVRGETLIATGDDVWTNEPNPSNRQTIYAAASSAAAPRNFVKPEYPLNQQQPMSAPYPSRASPGYGFDSGWSHAGYVDYDAVNSGYFAGESACGTGCENYRKGFDRRVENLGSRY
jgi:hypothetical protein